MPQTSPFEAYEAALEAFRADPSDENRDRYHRAEAAAQQHRADARAAQPAPKVWDTVNEVWVAPIRPETVAVTAAAHNGEAV